MKKLNIPLVVFLIVGFLATVIGVHFLHGYQVSRSADNLLARAKEAKSKGEVDEQIRLLQRYLRHRPKDVENLKVLLEASRERLFNSEDISGREIGQMLSALEKAIRNNPEDADLRRQGYIFSSTVGRFGDALDHLEQLKVLGKIAPQDRVVMARCLWLKGDTQAALAELEAMVGFDRKTETFDDQRAEAPSEIDAYTLLALILLRDGTSGTDVSIPQSIVDKAIERNPESPDAYLRRAGFYQENLPGEIGKQKSMADIDAALKLAPDDPTILLAAASTAMMLRDFERAESLADEGLQKHPDNPDMYAKRAEVARAQNETEEALAFINQGLEKHQMNRELLFRRGSYEVDLKRVDDARTTIERLGNRFDRIRVEILESRLLMADNDFAAASRRLTQLQSLGVPGRLGAIVTDLLANCNQRLGRLDKNLNLAGGDNNTPEGKLVTAITLVQLGRFEEANKLIEELMQSPDLTSQRREQLVPQVFPILIQIERAKPSSERDWTRIDKLARHLAGTLGLDAAARAQFEVELLVQKDMLNEARALAEKASIQFPTSARLRLLHAQLTPDPEQGLRMLEALERGAGDSAVLRLTKADKIEKIGGPEMAARLKELEQHGFSSPEDITGLYQGLIGVYRRTGMHQDALRLLRELLALHDKNLGIRVLSFDVAFESGDPNAMNEMLEEIAKVAGKDSAEWQVAEARRLLWAHEDQDDEQQLATVVRLLERAQAQRPDFAPIYMVRAEVQLQQNQPDAAIESIKSAIQKRPGEVSYLQRIIDVLISLNRNAEALRYVEQLPDQHRRPQDMIEQIRTRLVSDPQQAVQLAERLFPPTSENPMTLMYLVEIYEAANAIDKCLPVLQRAIELDPTQPRPWLVQVRSLVRLGKTEEAKAAIELMQAKIQTENPQLWLGQCYATVGDLAAAEQSYDEAIKKEPLNTVLLRNRALLFMATQQTEKLVTCLNQLIGIRNDSDPQTQTDVAWGRRTLAQHFGSTGTYQDFQKAVKLVEQNSPDVPSLAGEDLLLWLRLHANRLEASSRRKAVERLNQIADTRSLTSGETAILAYIHYAEGRWADAKKEMLELLAKNPNNMGFITTYIEWSLERGEFDEAAAWIRKLDQNSLEALKYSSILLAKRNGAQAAERRIVSLIPSRIDRMTAVRIMEDIAKFDKAFYAAAGRQWVSLVKEKPEMIHGFVGYLTRMPDGTGLEHALNLSEKQLKQAITDQRADIAAYYLNLGIKALRTHRKTLGSDSPHYERVYAWFDLARQAKVDELTLSWSEVDYFDVRREYDRLATLYTELLKRSDLDSMQKAVIRNNLAFIYAISNKGREALDIIGDAISQLGPQSDFLDTRGLAYLASGNVDRAIEDLRAAVEGGHGDASKFFHLALAEHHKGNATEAEAAYQSAMEMGFDEADLSTPEVKLYQQLKRAMESQLQENELSQVRSQK